MHAYNIHLSSFFCAIKRFVEEETAISLNINVYFSLELVYVDRIYR